MTSFTINVEDGEIRDALNRLSQRCDNMRSAFEGIGDDMVERTKRRFDTGTGPDGQAWAPNSAATLDILAERLGRMKSYSKKGGGLNKRGAANLAGKKPLIGQTKLLRQQINALADDSSVEVFTNSNTAAYAAIQQFGGKAGRGHKVTIPARPFLPIRQDGTLYPKEQEEVLDAINRYLLDSL